MKQERRTKEKGFGVVQQLDIDQGCRMMTRQSIVSSICTVCSLSSCDFSLPTQKLLLYVCAHTLDRETVEVHITTALKGI